MPLTFPVFLTRSLVLPVQWLSCASAHCPWKKPSSLCAVLWRSDFVGCTSPSPLLSTSLLSPAICRVSSDNHFAFCFSFSLGRFCSLPPVQHYEPLSIVLQAFCLLALIPSNYLSPQLYIHRGFKLYLAGLVVFPAFFTLSLNFAMRS